MVLKMWSCSAAWVPLVLVVLFAAANTEAACAADQKANCEKNAAMVFVKAFGNSSCTQKLMGEVCTTFKTLSKCLMDAGCEDFKNKTTKVAATNCTVGEFDATCMAATANGKPVCSSQRRADCKKQPETVFKQMVGTGKCMMSKIVGKACTAFNTLSKCLKNAGCLDFRTKSAKVAPTMCTVGQFDASCVPPIDHTDLKWPCNDTHKTKSKACFTQAETAFRSLKNATVCTKSTVTPALCQTYRTMSDCLAAKRLPCKPLESNTALVKGTKCTLKVFKDACSPPAKKITATTKRPAPKKKTDTGRQSGANDLSPFRTPGYSLVLFLCEAAVMLLVLQ